jgi:hypothetical protein
VVYFIALKDAAFLIHLLCDQVLIWDVHSLALLASLDHTDKHAGYLRGVRKGMDTATRAHAAKALNRYGRSIRPPHHPPLLHIFFFFFIPAATRSTRRTNPRRSLSTPTAS